MSNDRKVLRHWGDRYEHELCLGTREMIEESSGSEAALMKCYTSQMVGACNDDSM
jgi:hypothetical protein